MARRKKREAEFSTPKRCPHCGNVAPMELSARYSTVREDFVGEGPNAIHVEHGMVYDLWVCAACKKPTLSSYDWADYVNPEDIEVEVLYPRSVEEPPGLPTQVRTAFAAARRVESVDANAYAVLIGRMLELVCADRKARGRTLADQLADLAAKGEIPSKLTGVARGLRGFRNVGAHAGAGELSEAEVPILTDLALAILEYVYSAPHLASVAEAKLEKLRKRKIPGMRTNNGT